VKREVKSYAAAAKAAPEVGEGVIEAFASVFGNIDSYGDRMVPGAFTRTLGEWSAKGDPIPVIWSHRWDDPLAHIGVVVDIAEREIDGKVGLWYRGQLDLDGAFAAKVYRLMVERRVTQQSFAFTTAKAQYVDEANDSPFDMIREVTDVDLYEVGPTLIGANQQTALLEAASARVEAGDLSALEVLARAASTIGDVQHHHDLLVEAGAKCADLGESKASDPEGEGDAGAGDPAGTLMTLERRLLLARYDLT
jgi:uncharacterized protein